MFRCALIKISATIIMAKAVTNAPVIPKLLRKMSKLLKVLMQTLKTYKSKLN